VFVAALATPDGRLLSIAVMVASIIAYLLVYQVTQQRRVTGWVGNRSGGAASAVLRSGLVLALIAVIAAVAIGPNIPGADGKALVSWRNRNSEDRATRSTVSPFVDIRGRLVDSRSVEVFTVESPVRAYWRLTALDTFNGNVWASNESYRSVGSKLPSTGRDVAGAQTQQRIKVDTLDSIWLPAAYEPIRIDGVKNVSYNADSASLISSKDTTNGMTYTATSVIPNFTPAQLDAAGAVDRAQLARYLQLPRIAPRVRTLAQTVTRGKATEYDKALALQNYLRSAPFVYSTNVTLNHSETAIEQFLFETKKGYCEQFAGAYAVLARSIGLPTRIAVGFTAGNAEGDTYQVLNEHAHAWPEVYFPNVGWVAFEPTPGRAVPNGAAYTGIQDTDNQGGAGGTTETTLPDTTPTTAAGSSSPTTLPNEITTTDNAGKKADHSGLVTLVLVLLLIVALAALWLVGVPAMRRRRRDHRRAAARSSAARVLVYWEEANDVLAHAGAGRRPYETFGEHARRAGPQARLEGDVSSALLRLAGDATVANYGANELSSDVAARAEAAAATVEDAVLSRQTRARRLLWSIDPRPLVGFSSKPEVSNRA
jgi:transglutaminase-like putative cysteine protease